MPIVDSMIVESSRQSDGRFAVRELHTDEQGATYDVSYLAEPGTDQQAVMLARVPGLNQTLLDLIAAAAQVIAVDNARIAAVYQAQAYLMLTDEQLRSVLLMPPGSDLTVSKANIAIIAGGTI